MSAIPPIEPARALYPVQRLSKRQRREDEKERRFDSEDENLEQDGDDEQGDDRPHVDIRA